jgi:hypothetical protein
MLKAEQGSEIVVRVKNSVGALADLAKRIGDKGVSILAINGWVEGSEGVMRFVTDDNLRSMDALSKAGVKPQEKKVVIVHLPHKPGMLKHITEQLKNAKIDISHLYASAEENDSHCLVVMNTSDNQRAMVEMDKLK